ncbi:MAG: GHKL domain-containing protein [Eubacteriales bacterium]|nr:GHKL domain-containing protein [Eubacteriales bacterium]
MIRFLDILSFLFEWGYVFVFFWILRTFLTLRKNRPMRILAFALSSLLACVIVYSNDFVNLFGTLLGFAAYVAVFYRGRWMEKTAAVLVFYPAVIAVNYLMQDIGSRLFLGMTGAPGDMDLGWTGQQYLISTAVHTISLLLRLLFWLGSWSVLRSYLAKITSNLTTKMWMLIDVLMLAPFIAIFTIIYFLPEGPAIVYPICSASIFSSFGCIYLASYICNSMQTAYRAQELEMQRNYYKDRIRDEERVRSVYHDMKNHLLLLQAQAGNGQEVQRSIQELKGQIQEYENYHHTGNEFLDIIIRDKAKAAQEKKIDFSAVISFEAGSFIEPLDISTIFGNALDNAIEASEKLSEDRRLITVRANRVRDMLVIIVENNTLSVLTEQEGTTKNDTFVHGFGLPNLKNAVEKYDGHCNKKLENGMFTLKIIIPIP